MTNTNLLQAMGRIDPKLIADAAPDVSQKKNVKNMMLKYGALAACILLIASLSLNIMYISKTNTPHTGTTGTPNTTTGAIISPNGTVIWSDPSGVGTYYTVLWNGWNMKKNLYDEIINADNQEIFAIQVIEFNEVEYNNSYFDGTNIYSLEKKLKDTYGKYEAARNLSNNPSVLSSQEFQYISQYGKKMYTTGAPDGTKWTFSYYKRYEAIYNCAAEALGEDFIEQYIQTPTEAKNKIHKYYSDLEKQYYDQLGELNIARIAFRKAYDAYTNKKNLELFGQAGICATIKNNSLYIFVTKEQLANFETDSNAFKTFLTLKLAQKNEFFPNNTDTAESSVVYPDIDTT